MFGPVNEEHTKYIFKQVVETIQHLHLIGYCHNDIKDENIIINTKTRAIKLIDFGSATPMEPGQTFTLFYGTKKFAAPEAISGEYYYPEAQEVWALGTLLYVLLFKMDPFKTDQEIVDLDIARRVHKLRYPRHGVGHDISDDAVEAILAMLEKDYQQRLSASEILKLSFFDSVRDD
ncbi:kinase-like domain-containing protein [Polychytrium aggregatum]|uniref:kinase-like domain-containing protein n=1 Tax=Polychytrium aggregatum TaxID=110093 RepID=UPI0022FDDA7F|nr:kinase-like domain-containing protein [Polychytrium aggregatum]KAI9206963.1 kinase-like domain-containing protein [Polychytrium aggregatum]